MCLSCSTRSHWANISSGHVASVSRDREAVAAVVCFATAYHPRRRGLSFQNGTYGPKLAMLLLDSRTTSAVLGETKVTYFALQRRLELVLR